MSRLASTIGRASDLSAVADALASRASLTLVGAPGVGKSLLARAAADAFARARGVPIVAIECGGETSDPRAALLSALRADAGRGPAGVAHLLEGVRARGAALYLFDGCEAAIEEAGELVELCAGADDEVRVLATSRQRLGLTGEATYEVLPFQPPALAASPLELSSNPAVAMLARGRSRPPAELAELGEIARRLDGLPAALELAAALLDTLSPSELIARLGSVGRGLEASLRASWERLDEEARGALHTAAMLGRPFALDELEAAAPEDRAQAMAGALHALVARSLVVSEPRRDRRRFRLLRPVQDFALAERGGSKRAPLELAAYDRLVVERAERAPEATETTLEPLVACAKRRLAAAADDELGRRALRAIKSFFVPRALCVEVDAILGRLLATEPPGPTSIALRGQRARVLLSLMQLAGARREAERAAGEARASNDRELELRLLLQLAEIRAYAGMGDAAEQALARARALADALARPEHALAVAMSTSKVAWRCGSAAVAFDSSVRGLALAEQLQDADATTMIRARLGQNACAAGHLELGHAQLARALAEATAGGAPRLVISIRTALGLERLTVGDVDGAHEQFACAAALSRAEGHPRLLVWADVYLGITEVLRGGDGHRLEEAALRADLDEPLFLLVPLFATLTGSLIGRSLYLDARGRVHAAGEALAWLRPLLQCCDAALRGEREEMLRLAAALPPAFRGDFDHAARLLDHARARGGAPGSAGLLRVAADGSWFEAPPAGRVSLRGSSTTRSLLLCLCRARLARPSQAVPMGRLLEAAWPGDRSRKDAIANRLYVALTRLRDKGLRGWLTRNDEGWLIPAELQVELVEEG